jgi:peptide chain release factor subunit 3
MDTNEEERAKGKTVEVGRANFETANRRFTVLDAPGHRSYVPNMIAGASQADVGVLLISARKGEFETGFEKGGQTREHALLAKTLGVEKLICAINKMDDSSVGWAQERYNEIVNKVRPFLKTNGFKDDQISFLPISGLKGDNVKDRMDTPAWFTGQTLLEVMDAIEIPRSGDESALRMPITDSYKDMGAVVATGKIEQGTIVPGMKCILAPTGIKCSVSCVSIKDEPVKFAKHGENVSLKMAGICEEDLKKGFVLCPLANPLGAVSKFRAMLHVLELADDRHVLTAGYKSVLHVHAATEECEIIRLEEACPFSNATQVEQNPKYVRGKSRLTCTISVARPLALDAFAGVQQLGRFTLRMEDKTIAIGKVIELLSSPKNAM